MARGNSDRRTSSRLIWLLVIIVLLVPIPVGDQPWFFSGLLFRAFDWLNSQLPSNF